MRLRIAWATDPGLEREENEDSVAVWRNKAGLDTLIVVCDGMGGHAAGREAAELALSTIFETFDRMPDGTPPAHVLRAAVEEASRRVYAMHTNEVALGRPGSTVVAVLLNADGAEVAHVGDSRAYLVHEGQVFRVTRDHSVVQELVDRGILTLQQAAHHPDANRITRALGMAPEVEVEVRPQPVHYVAGDAFVLCSDGLSDLVEDHEILAIVGSDPAAQAVGKLVDLANARGGHDNVTVIVLRARENATAIAGAVAPTVAQTDPAQGPVTMPSSTQGFVAPLLDRAPQLPFASRALEPTPAPETLQTLPEKASAAPPMVVAGILLAVVAMGLLGAVLVHEFAERSGKRNVETDAPLKATPADAASVGPVPLLPESVVIPAPSAPAQPIAPLEPAPSTMKKGRR